MKKIINQILEDCCKLVDPHQEQPFRHLMKVVEGFESDARIRTALVSAAVLRFQLGGIWDDNTKLQVEDQNSACIEATINAVSAEAVRQIVCGDLPDEV